MEKKDVVKRMMLTNVLRRTAMREIMGEIHFGQEPILDFLIKNGSSSQKQIAESLHVTPASIALSTKRMEKSGLISKIPDKNNLRQNIISVTDKGKQLLACCDEHRDHLDDAMFKGFSDDELTQMAAFYDKIIFNLTGESQNITHDVFCHYINKLKALDKKNKERNRENKK